MRWFADWPGVAAYLEHHITTALLPSGYSVLVEVGAAEGGAHRAVGGFWVLAEPGWGPLLARLLATELTRLGERFEGEVRVSVGEARTFLLAVRVGPSVPEEPVEASRFLVGEMKRQLRAQSASMNKMFRNSAYVIQAASGVIDHARGVRPEAPAPRPRPSSLEVLLDSGLAAELVETLGKLMAPVEPIASPEMPAAEAPEPELFDAWKIGREG